MDLGQEKRDQGSIAPPHKGPRRLAFRIRGRPFTFEGGPSLLIRNRYGVWSVGHRRYVRKTRYHRFHDLKEELDPIRATVRELGMSRWPRYSQDEELRSLRQKLADLYWGVMPEEARARTARQLDRDRRERRRLRKLRCFAAALVCLAVVGFVLLRLVRMGCCSLRVRLFLGSVYLVSAYLLDIYGAAF
ncbi:hypothetical protein PVAP13_9NG157500 [Panicum virgatum]|uniref:Uncharacterized protein n=1 Tax=Panicum virgatum TaxID=38727 RepID=A0A8T0MLS6_PANVG|nr:hypothetical protein PVAP13_9NG157500 [Panicum virgatum]